MTIRVSWLWVAWLAATPAVADAYDLADAYTLPPSWDSSEADVPTPEEPKPPKKKKKAARPWYEPRFAMGTGASFPELLPIDGYAFFGHYFALRAFYAPALPLAIRVEMPSDVISTTKGVAVANPAFDIKGKATLGPSYGAEAMVFPFGGAFFLDTGLSHRKIRLVADAESPVLVCGLVEAAKDPPCGDPNAAIETRTQLTAHADATTEATLVRMSLGWMWNIGSFGYFVLNAGAARPTHVHRTVNDAVGLAEPGSPDPDINGALAQVRSEQDAKLRDEAQKAIAPVDQQVVPILGLGAGIRF